MVSARVTLFAKLFSWMLLASFFPVVSYAQEASSTAPNDQGYITRAVILHTVSDEILGNPTFIPRTHTEIVSARISSGKESGKVVKLTNEYTDGDGQQLNPGDIVYVERFKESGDGDPIALYIYTSVDHDRTPAVILFVLLFLGCLLYFGGKQGLRGLVSLIGGISLIVFVFLPGIQQGFSPVLLSIVVASFVATIGAYITHGFSKMTTSAVIGMTLTIILAALLSEIAVHFGHLSGVTDEVAYNMMNDPINGVIINFQGLLLGGIIIGMLGILYDAAIGQSVAVEELVRAGPHLPASFIFDRAYRIGREHIGALVNTLVMAYVGASLPIILMVYQSTFSYYHAPLFNLEFLASEIIRTTVGATALILTIPLTTWVAVRMLVKQKENADPLLVEKEREAIQSVKHTH